MANTRKKLLIKYLLPSILSQLSIFLFTIVDGIFVGQGVGSDGLGAVNIVFPYVMIFNAFLMLVTIGGLTVTAIRFGRGDTEGANEIFMHSMILSLAVSLLFSLAAVFLTEPLCVLMGASEEYLQLTYDYLFWYGVFLVPCGLLTTFNGFVRNDGRPGIVTAGVIIATSLNIFGDWLLIFPFKMGLKGAAVATGLAQTIGCLIVLSHFLLKKGKLHFKRYKISGSLIGKIIVRGLPECVAQFCTPLTVVITNIIMVGQLGSSAENAYSIIGYVASFAIAFFYGVAEGMQPIFGRYYGSDNFKELKFYKRAGLIMAAAGSALVTVIVILLRKEICVLYGADPQTTEVVIKMMPVYAWGFVAQAFTVVISAYFYSTTRTKQSLIINIIRSFIADTVITIFVPMIFGAETVWYTFLIFEALVAILAVIVMAVTDRKGIRAGLE